MTLQYVKLDNLKLAPENARAKAKPDLTDLKRSIPVVGIVQPLSGYKDGDAIAIDDGGRRLRALQRLQKEGKLPEAIAKQGVPVLVHADRETAQLRSMASFIREDLDAAQELATYAKLFKAGQNPEEIAAACNVEAKRVRQLLKLVNVAPEVLKLFFDDKISLDAVEAFTLTDSQDLQREVLEALTTSKKLSAYYVRERLRKGVIRADDVLARYVGRKAYEAAGGGFMVDLFQGPEREDWTDAGLVQRLADEKLAKDVEKVKAEGWAWVEVVAPNNYNYGRGLVRQQPIPADLTEDEAKAKAEAEALVAEASDEDEDTDEVQAAYQLLDQLEARPAEFTAEQKAEGGCFVQLQYDGKLRIERGYAKAKPKAGDPAAPAADVGLHGWGHDGHWRLTHVATAAVRHAMAKNPAAAYDVAVAHMAWTEFGTHRETALRLRGEGARVLPFKLAGEEGWHASRDGWREKVIAPTFAETLANVVALKPKEKAELLALCFAATLDATEPRSDSRRRDQWAQLVAIGGHVGVDVVTAWRPDAGFLAKGSKPALQLALGEVGRDPRAYDKAKKSEMVAALAAKVDESGWTPKVLRDLIPRAPEPVEDAAEGEAAPEAANAPETAPEPVLLAAE